MERDGDGWIDCSCGARHWGRLGAAGLLLLDPQRQLVLLQLRAEWSHNGGTWGIPGGARDSHETALQAALREAHEELGVDTALVSVVDDFVDDHGTWRYDTVIATTDSSNINLVHNRETTDAAWLAIDQVQTLPLHHAFAAAWPTLLRQLNALSGDIT